MLFRSEDSEQIINEQKKEIRKLKLQNVKKENKIREEKRIEFINQKIKVWRKKNMDIIFYFCLTIFNRYNRNYSIL